MTLSERFWRHCMLLDDSEDSCWIWTGPFRDGGQGRAMRHGKEITAHRLAYELQNGHPAPEGYRLEQTCAHPQCVRHWKVAGKYRKLGPADVRNILKSGMANRALARMYGVSEFAIRRVRLYLHRGALRA